MITTITDLAGNVFGFNSENGLISKNSVIVSGEDYEPCFLNSGGGPVFTGIYLKKEGKVLTLSGHVSNLVNPETL